MTKAEAIKEIRTIIGYYDILVGPSKADQETVGALTMAVEALQIDIVRCGECEHKADNYCYKHSHEVTDSDFCSYGERSEDE